MQATRETVLTRIDQRAQHRPTYRLSVRRALLDWGAQRLFGLAAVAIGGLVFVIAATLLVRTVPLLHVYPLSDLLTGQVWQPMRGLFGFAPFIVGSIAVTGVAMALAVIPAILCGIYLAEYVNRRTRTLLKPVLDLLVGIPSVVYGLWGILVIVPLVRDHLGPWSDRTLGRLLPFFSQTNPSGYGLLAAGIVLAVMVFPLIVAVTEEVIRSVPDEMRQTLLALGATRWESTKCIVRHAGLPGILAAIVLGFSRAFGETLAVMMTVGNVARIPGSLFDAAYPLPALIANNYGEMMSVPLYESALMGAALLLLAVVVCFNAGAQFAVERLVRRRNA
ncbi:MAG: phosphate ABC transporter permease subunit PstC [Chloroflexi bacterium]|nr:MAG: phosphate ABC transporter permease subunit PstC [Chloroflexota bacterium]